MVVVGEKFICCLVYVLYVFLVRENDEIPGLRVMEGKRDFLERKRGGHPRLFSGVLWVALLLFFLK
jgi:hypothetical protein